MSGISFTTGIRGYALADRGDEGWWYADSEEWEISDEQVIGWREIHE